MTSLAAHGLAVELLPGWDGRITLRDDGRSEALRSEGGVRVMIARPRPVLHVANFGLPEERGDFGGGAVELMGERDVLVILFEYEPEATATALFAAVGMPRSLDVGDFGRETLRRGLPGQGGHQAFFQQTGRAFCLYAVLGSYAARSRLVPLVNRVLASVRIEPRGDG